MKQPISSVKSRLLKAQGLTAPKGIPRAIAKKRLRRKKRKGSEIFFERRR